MAPKRDPPAAGDPETQRSIDLEFLRLIEQFRAEDKKEFDAKLRDQGDEFETKLRDQGDAFRKTISLQRDGTTPQLQAMAPDEIVKLPRMASFAGSPCAPYQKGIHSFFKIYHSRTRKMGDEDKAKHMIPFFTGQVGEYAAFLLAKAWDQKVPVTYRDFCKDLRVFVEGEEYLETQLDDVTRTRQKPGEPLTHFAFDFQEGLDDLVGHLDTVPTQEHDRCRIFVRLVEPVIREKMREHENEIRNFNAYAQKANTKGLGGFTRKVQTMEPVKSTSASFTPRASGSFTPRANSRLSQQPQASDAQIVNAYNAYLARQENGASDDDDSDQVFDVVQEYDDAPYTYGYDQPHSSGH